MAGASRCANLAASSQCPDNNRATKQAAGRVIPSHVQYCSAAYPVPAQASHTDSGAFAALIIGSVGGGIALIVLAVAAVAAAKRYRSRSNGGRGADASEAAAAAPRMQQHAGLRTLEMRGSDPLSAPAVHPVFSGAQPDADAFAGGRTARDLVVADAEEATDEPFEATQRSPPAGAPHSTAAPQPATGELGHATNAEAAAAAEAAGAAPGSAGRRERQRRELSGALAASAVERRSDGLLLGRLQQWLRSLLARAPPVPSGAPQDSRCNLVRSTMRAGRAGRGLPPERQLGAAASAQAAVSANPLHAALSGGRQGPGTADYTNSGVATEAVVQEPPDSTEASDGAGTGLTANAQARRAAPGARHCASGLRRRNSIGSPAGGCSSVVVVQAPSPLRQVRELAHAHSQQQQLHHHEHEQQQTTDAHAADSSDTDAAPRASPPAVAITVEGCDAASPLYAVAHAAASSDPDAAPPLRAQRNTAQSRKNSTTDSVVWVASPGGGALKAASVTLPRLRSFARPLTPVQLNPLSLLAPTAGVPPPSAHRGAAGTAPIPLPPGVPMSPQLPPHVAPATASNPAAATLAPAASISARNVVRALALSARPPRTSGSGVPEQTAGAASLTAVNQRVTVGTRESAAVSRNPLSSTLSETASAETAGVSRDAAAASNPLRSAALVRTPQASPAPTASTASSGSSRRLHNPLHGMLPPEAPVVPPPLGAAGGTDGRTAAGSNALRIQNPLQALLRRVGPGHTASGQSTQDAGSGSAASGPSGSVTARGAGSMPAPPPSTRASLAAAATGARAQHAAAAPDDSAGAVAYAPSWSSRSDGGADSEGPSAAASGKRLVSARTRARVAVSPRPTPGSKHGQGTRDAGSGGSAGSAAADESTAVATGRASFAHASSRLPVVDSSRSDRVPESVGAESGAWRQHRVLLPGRHSRAALEHAPEQTPPAGSGLARSRAASASEAATSDGSNV